MLESKFLLQSKVFINKNLEKNSFFLKKCIKALQFYDKFDFTLLKFPLSFEYFKPVSLVKKIESNTVLIKYNFIVIYNYFFMHNAKMLSLFSSSMLLGNSCFLQNNLI